METSVYTLTRDPTRRFSIAPDVDALYWDRRGEAVTVLETHPSVGQAFRHLRSGKGSPGDRLPPPPVSLWERWERAAHSLRPLLAGRSLLWDEVKGLVRELAEPMEDRELRAVLQTMCLAGMAIMLPGVEIPPAVSRWRCNRCGSGPEGLFRSRCGRCGGECVSCDRCLFLGRSRACTPLFFFLPEEKGVASEGFRRVGLRLPALTEGQKWVSDRCLEAVRSGQKLFLVWAVTGSGKTEAVLPAVHRVLEGGGRVLWVSPRRDVVEELAPRLNRAFPDFPVNVLHGESGWVRTSSPLTAATAHQAWRFYRCFQLVVVDEVDAFPLKGDPLLRAGVERAAAEGGTILWLTATPPSDWRRRLARRQLPGVILPVRHHGHPLPEPRLFRMWRLWSSLDRGRPLPPVTAFLERVVEHGGQGLLFVPRVADVDRLLSWIRRRHPDRFGECRGVSGRDGERKRILEELRRGDIRFLITTTVLERGVTLPRCHVLVFGADHPVFDAPALVQIAGRVGRAADYRSGEVWFLFAERTEGQLKAIREIRWMNRMARRRGWLKEEGENGCQ
ncbi:MAG: helicase-related protein [Planifilum fimeticola]